jgi:hypothetical protein
MGSLLDVMRRHKDMQGCYEPSSEGYLDDVAEQLRDLRQKGQELVTIAKQVLMSDSPVRCESPVSGSASPRSPVLTDYSVSDDQLSDKDVVDDVDRVKAWKKLNLMTRDEAEKILMKLMQDGIEIGEILKASKEELLAWETELMQPCSVNGDQYTENDYQVMRDSIVGLQDLIQELKQQFDVNEGDINNMLSYLGKDGSFLGDLICLQFESERLSRGFIELVKENLHGPYVSASDDKRLVVLSENLRFCKERIAIIKERMLIAGEYFSVKQNVLEKSSP